jgi:zinc finger protein
MAEKKEPRQEGKVEILEGETCPVCAKKELTLTEADDDIPYFGKVFIFGMRCGACGYNKSDIEAAEQKPPVKQTFEVKSKEDLNVRIVRSSEATIKIPHVGSMEPGAAAEGFVTNVEGVIERFKKQIESIRDAAEDEEDRKKAKNMLKKLQRVLWGDETLKITIEDPTGNSGIIEKR